jgi:hypothetical protein
MAAMLARAMAENWDVNWPIKVGVGRDSVRSGKGTDRFGSGDGEAPAEQADSGSAASAGAGAPARLASRQVAEQTPQLLIVNPFR